MSAAAATADASADAKPKKSKKLLFIIIGVVVLALVGGWLVLIPMLLAPLFIHQATRAADRMALALHRQHEVKRWRGSAPCSGIGTMASIWRTAIWVLAPSNSAIMLSWSGERCCMITKEKVELFGK